MIKNVKISKKLISIFLISSIIICAIIVNAIMTYCDVNLTLKTVIHNNKEYNIYTDVIKLHTKANGYSNVLGFEMNNNLKVYQYPGPGVDMQMDSAKMQGYGNYVMKSDTSLFDFIEYCYSNNPNVVNDSSTYGTATDFNYCNYTLLLGYKGQTLNRNSQTYVDNFWNRMIGALGETFNSYQDSYFFDRFTSKGAKLVFSLSNLSRWKDKVEDGSKEFLTCMTSYLFSMNPNSAPGAPDFDIKKGDIVPFLYVKEHVDDTDISNNPRELAKYAYVALVNGWASCPNNNLWLEEFDYMYSYEEQEDLVEDLELLEEWYSDTETKYQDQKGKKGNNLLGSTIETIIKSDYSITQQLEATEYYLQNIEGIGDYKENMARNELMAKYMMENSHIGDIIEDYNVGINFITENLQRGTSEAKNTSTAVLSDFQVLEFEHKLDKDGHSDDDGLTDLEELTGNKNGNVDSHVIWVNLTGMLDKTYNNRKANGETVKPTFAEQMEDLANKNPGIFKYEGGKCLYKTYDYSSNPMLNDTDFDGMQDNIDSNKIDGTFKGSANNIGQVEYVSDFRYFFVDNNKYNDELSTMSLMMSNLANDDGTAPLHGGSQKIIQYMQNLGFSTPLHKTSFKISDTENISGNLYLAKKTIQVGANKKAIKRYKDVYGVFLGGFDTEINYKKFMANFDSEEVKTYYENIVNDIVSYINTNKPSTFNDYCYWVTGYSVAGGIASEVAAKLKEDKEVYCYTFGATNGSSSGAGAFAEIKNVINEDDLYPKIYNKEEGFSRSGALYNDSIFDNLQSEYKQFIGSKYYSDTKNYTDAVSPKTTNTIAKCIRDVKNVVSKNEWQNTWVNNLSKYLISYNKVEETFNSIVNPIQSYFSVALKKALNNAGDKVRKAHDIKAYYVLSKSLNGFDLNNEDSSWTAIEEIVESEKDTNDDTKYPENLVSTIETVGNYYINNVPTYETGEKSGRTTQTQRNNKSLKKEWGINLYNYPALKNEAQSYVERTIGQMESAYREEYETDTLPTNNLTEFLYTAGDDCVRFGMAVFNYVTKGKLIDLHKEILDGKSGTSKKNAYFNYGLTVLNRNANTFVDSTYELDDWFDSMGYYRIEVDEDFDIEDLKPGDFLCASGGSESGHVEFYLGFNYTNKTDYETGEVTVERKSKINKINNTETNGGKAESTYGWGTVSNKMPSYEIYNGSEYNWYFYKSSDDKHIYRCRGYHEYTTHTDKCCDQRAYDVIYRQNKY